jgi:chorismate mutase
VKDALSELRSKIDKIDDLLIQKTAERMQIAEKIGQYKKDNGITILQVNRWDEILQKRTAYAKALKLSPEFTEKLLELLHAESIRRQTEIMNKGEVQPVEKLTHA